MCFGGTPKYSAPAAPEVTPAPTATEIAKANAAIPPSVATASPAPTEISAQERRKRIAAAKYGMMSTIKTSPQGVLNPVGSLTNDQGKKTLGS